MKLCQGLSGYLTQAIQDTVYQRSTYLKALICHHLLVSLGYKSTKETAGQSTWEELWYKPLKNHHLFNNHKYHLVSLCSLWQKIHNMIINSVRTRESYLTLTTGRRDLSDAIDARLTSTHISHSRMVEWPLNAICATSRMQYLSHTNLLWMSLDSVEIAWNAQNSNMVLMNSKPQAHMQLGLPWIRLSCL